MQLTDIPTGRYFRAATAAVASFVAVGTVTAVWANPFFVRMTPIGNWELTSLVLLSALTGIFVLVKRPSCRARKAGLGGILSFVGIACPTCNKILMLIFGGQALLTWFDPIRPFVTAAGIIVLLAAIGSETSKSSSPFGPPERQES